MKSLSLRARLLLWSSAASAVTLALVVALVDVTFRANIRDQLEVGLTFARQVAESARVSQMDARISDAVMMAVDTRLRAAVATRDPATVSQTLGEVFPSGTRGWAAVVAADGSVQAATDGAPHAELLAAESLVSEAFYYDTADLWLVGDDLVEVAASSILFGASPLAVLVTGQPLAADQVTALETSVGLPVAVLINGRSILGAEAEALSKDGRRAVAEWGEQADDAVDLVELGSERFFAAATALSSNSGSRLGTVVLLGSYDEALRPSNRLRAALIGIFFLGLFLTFAVSSVFSRGITVPVGRLLGETERLAQGNLENPIIPVRNDEIGRLAHSFEDMRVSLRAARSELIRVERLGAIGKAASAVAHDFTQPLSTIAGAVGLLRMDGEAPEVRERCFAAIEGELDRLQRMKQEIVEFARGESSLDDAEVRVDSFLENTVSALRTQCAEQSVVLTLEHGFTGEWYLDSYRLGRVIENLVRNAAAAIGTAGAITIRSATADGSLVITVEDTGPGIPPDRIDEIFEPFVSYGKKEGTGLGLAIARNVVRQHDGVIEVASSTEGTRFTMVLPRRGKAPANAPTHSSAELVPV